MMSKVSPMQITLRRCGHYALASGILTGVFLVDSAGSAHFFFFLIFKFRDLKWIVYGSFCFLKFHANLALNFKKQNDPRSSRSLSGVCVPVSHINRELNGQLKDTKSKLFR